LVFEILGKGNYMKAKYVHTNLIAVNWRSLADFYIKMFGCEIVLPERDYSGKDLDDGTRIQNAHLQGVHLRLPGWENNETGPTLEIYSYNKFEIRENKKVNSTGFGHIAFEVANVSKARQEAITKGAKDVGKIVTLTTKTGSKVKWCYMSDPEGNIFELQSWNNKLQHSK
jgi:glyoxylase I family protein